jgi:hypothetical protein
MADESLEPNLKVMFEAGEVVIHRKDAAGEVTAQTLPVWSVCLGIDGRHKCGFFTTAN